MSIGTNQLRSDRLREYIQKAIDEWNRGNQNERGENPLLFGQVLELSKDVEYAAFAAIVDHEALYG